MEKGTIYSLDFIRDEIKSAIKKYGDDLECIEITYDVLGNDEGYLWKIRPQLRACVADKRHQRIIEQGQTPSLEDYGAHLTIGEGYEFIESGEECDYEEKRELLISDCRKVYFALRKEFPMLHRDLARYDSRLIADTFRWHKV